MLLVFVMLGSVSSVGVTSQEIGW